MKSEPNKPYDSSCIRILSDEEQLIFDFKFIDYLVHKYTKSKDFIQRGIEASRLSGLEPKEYFIPKYLDKDSSIPINEDFNLISRELQKESRQ